MCSETSKSKKHKNSLSYLKLSTLQMNALIIIINGISNDDVVL